MVCPITQGDHNNLVVSLAAMLNNLLLHCNQLLSLLQFFLEVRHFGFQSIDNFLLCFLMLLQRRSTRAAFTSCIMFRYDFKNDSSMLSHMRNQAQKKERKSSGIGNHTLTICLWLINLCCSITGYQYNPHFTCNTITAPNETTEAASHMYNNISHNVLTRQVD